ncbi:MAG: hypothetical protein KGJ80_09290 [Chloroflexota bacterium]|nr:hypothetical protein [Chloroflexota bacterium]
MYAIELAAEFAQQIESLHPKRYRQISLRIFALQTNPRPPESIMLEPDRYLVRVGSYQIAYRIDDTERRIRVLLLEEHEEE